MSIDNILKPRKAPIQARSKKRMAAIIKATELLVGERGNDAVSTREIAVKAGVPISSIYQYFSDKNGILRHLMLGYMERLQDMVKQHFDQVTSLHDVPIAINGIIDSLSIMFRNESALAGIWAAVQANAVLRKFDIEDTRILARFIATQINRVAPMADPREVYELCWHAAWTVPSAVRIAFFTQAEEGDAIIKHLKKNLERSFRVLIEK